MFTALLGRAIFGTAGFEALNLRRAKNIFMCPVGVVAQLSLVNRILN